MFPGFDGGAEWGGPAFDPETGLLYVNANEMVWTGGPAQEQDAKSGRQLYMQHCANCHSETLAGAPPQMPSLLQLGQVGSGRDLQDHPRRRRADARIPEPVGLGREGRLRVRFLSGREQGIQPDEAAAVTQLDYRFTGYHKFLDPDGYPAVAPPWGTLNAINLNTGEYAWKVPLGEYPGAGREGA